MHPFKKLPDYRILAQTLRSPYMNESPFPECAAWYILYQVQFGQMQPASWEQASCNLSSNMTQEVSLLFLFTTGWPGTYLCRPGLAYPGVAALDRSLRYMRRVGTEQLHQKGDT